MSAPGAVLVALDKGTAARIRKASQRIEVATKERDHWIVEAHGFGASLREIAACAGLSHVGVMKIIRRASTVC